MALGENYILITDLKNRLGITDTQDDTRLAGAVETASREVELFCNRQFNDAETTTAREYEPLSPGVLVVDDFHTTTGLVVAVVELGSEGSETVTTLSASSVRVGPRPNSEGRIGYPFWLLTNYSTTRFPIDYTRGFVRVTARWGWAAVPEPVKEATLILAEEYFKLKEAPFGVANWGEFGPMRVQENRVVRGLLQRYRRGGVRVR